MKKQLNAIFLLAGTAIGSGMLSLPIVLARYGLFPSCIIMCLFAWLTYFTSTIRTDLNINSDPNFSLRDVGKYFSGNVASKIGSTSLKLLSYSLIAAYLYGAASLLRAFFHYDLNVIILITSILIILILASSINIININKKLFAMLLLVLFIVIIKLFQNLDFANIELSIPNFYSNSISFVFPIVFTSFGFQGSLHSLTRFVNNDKKLIKRACLYGSLIPAIVYISWVTCVILVIFGNDIEFFKKMQKNNVELSELILCLTNISNCAYIKIISWIISILALFTSIIGVCVAIFDEWRTVMNRKLNPKFSKIIPAIITIIPATFVAILIPNAFIKVLNISGMILSVIAIFLPNFLYLNMVKQKNLKISKLKWFGIAITTIIGLFIFSLGLKDLFNEIAGFIM